MNRCIYNHIYIYVAVWCITIDGQNTENVPQNAAPMEKVRNIETHQELEIWTTSPGGKGAQLRMDNDGYGFPRCVPVPYWSVQIHQQFFRDLTRLDRSALNIETNLDLDPRIFFESPCGVLTHNTGKPADVGVNLITRDPSNLLQVWSSQSQTVLLISMINQRHSDSKSPTAFVQNVGGFTIDAPLMLSSQGLRTTLWPALIKMLSGLMSAWIIPHLSAVQRTRGPGLSVSLKPTPFGGFLK